MTESDAVPVAPSIHVGFVEGFFANDEVRVIIHENIIIHLKYLQLRKLFVMSPAVSLSDNLNSQARDIFLAIVDMINKEREKERKPKMPRTPAEFVGE